MGMFGSIYRYIVTLGGLIGGDVDGATDKMLTTPGGVRTTFSKTREKWTKQYSEVREAVAQLMMVLEQKRNSSEELATKQQEVKTKMQGAVLKYQQTNEPKYQEAFNALYAQDQGLDAQMDALQEEIEGMRGKVGNYRSKLQEMDSRIKDLGNREAAAIADIVSSQQIISLNDRLNALSSNLDDRNLQAIETRRATLLAQAKLSGELAAPAVEEQGLDEELLQAGAQTEANDVFAAMLAEAQAKAPSAAEQSEAESGAAARNL